jgi:hypothetical protein
MKVSATAKPTSEYNTVSAKENNMRSKVVGYVVAVSAIIFASGVAVGQRTSASKFAKYLRPSVRSELEWKTLEADVDSIRGSLPYRKGISIPEHYYKEDRLQARAVISPDFEKAPLETVKGQLLGVYGLEYVHLKSAIPELSEDDFVLSVYRASDFQLFAECKHGNIVFH